MIFIEERKPCKVPGMTSFFISFNYNQDIINELSKLDCGKDFNRKTKEWEIPVCNLGSTIDILCSYDDISLKLLSEDIEKPLPIKMDENSFKTHPFPYQLEGIEYGISHKKWLLLDEMGLGKSLQAIYIAESLYNQDKLKHCLIICGVNNLKSNWKKEINRHSKLNSIILGERVLRNGKINTDPSSQERINHLMSPIEEFFIITNIESLRNDKFIEALEKSPNQIDMIIIDEIHKAKDPSSHQGSNLLKTKSEYKLGMTGTPLMNNPLDVYVPLNWIEADKSTLTNFKSTYCTFADKYHSIVIGYKNLKMLKDQLSQVSLRRLKDDVLDLPQKNIIEEYIDMDSSQLSFYNDIKQGIIDEVDKVHMTTSSLLAMVTRLRQATACPSILTSNKDIISSKLNRAKDLTEQILENKDKVVIFSTYKESVYKLEEMLKSYSPLICTGDSSDEETSNAVDKFQNDPECKVFIGTWQKCGTGLTLTAASYMIFIDTPWTSAVYTQAQDRIYRIGTNKPVFIYNLICKDTIDERVLEILNNKQALSDYIIDDTITQSGIDSLRKYIEDLS